MFNLENPIKFSHDFYLQDTITAAKDLLGKILVRNNNGKHLAAMIVETEAYLKNDESSHSFIGKRERNKSMFENGGILYVYQIYGIHFCCNVVTNKIGVGEAVLIRAVEPLSGIEQMGFNRYGKKNLSKTEVKNLSNGPAKLCKALAITKQDDGVDLSGDEISIFNGEKIAEDKIIKTTRIGITKSSELPFRFYIKGNDFISKK